MIEHLKHKLFFRYTLILFLASLVVFLGGYRTYRYISEVVIEGSLRDYLQEEIFEFKNDLATNRHTPKRVAVWSSQKSLHYFTYWFKNKELVHFVQPSGSIGSKLTQNITEQDVLTDIPFQIKIQDGSDQWQFLAVGQSWADIQTDDTLTVIALQNISPYVYSSKQYKSYGFFAVAILCLICMLIAARLALNAVKPLEESIKRQKTFISDASHEMKTPLSVLMAYTEIIEKKNGTSPETDVIKSEIKNMSALIENLLSLSKIENKQSNSDKEKINPDILLKEVIALFQKTDQNKHKIELKIQNTAPLLMSASDFKRIVTILTDNALKYTPVRKSVFINADCTDKNFCLSVKDEGIGISSEDLPHIFERFYRADQTRQRQNGSFGLGLALLNEIVQKYKGSVNVKSELQHGSEFTVYLPLTTNLSLKNKKSA